MPDSTHYYYRSKTKPQNRNEGMLSRADAVEVRVAAAGNLHGSLGLMTKDVAEGGDEASDLHAVAEAGKQLGDRGTGLEVT